MSLDLGAMLDQAVPLVISAIQTGGTLITIDQVADDDTITVDPSTLAVTVSNTTIAAGIPALVLPDSATATPAGPARPVTTGRYRILLLPDVDLPTEPTVRLLITVTASRDPAQVGLQLRVGDTEGDIETSTAGVIRILHGTRQVTT